MAAGIQIDSNATQVREAFRRFVQWNHRDQDFLWQDQSRRFATDLYNATAEIAPTRAEIAADVKALGWRIPTKFPDGRMGRGTPAQWVQTAWQKRKLAAKRRRGRPTKEEAALFGDKKNAFFAKFGQRPTLAQMQAFVIKMRNNARLYLASGWLGAIADLGGNSRVSNGFVNHDRGGAIIRRPGPGMVQVMLWNRSRGIEDVDAKKGIVAKATAARVAGMDEYVRDHQRKVIDNFKLAA